MSLYLVLATEGPSRPMTEWLIDQLGLTDNLMARAFSVAIDRVLQILLIVVLAGVAIRLLKRAVRRAVERAKSPPTGARALGERIGLLGQPPAVVTARRSQRVDAIAALANSVISVVLWVLALFLILGVFAIQLGPLIAGAGIVGIALGFGAQSVVRDFLSGVFMLLEDQFGVGDIVNVGEAIGVVEGVTLRTTRVRDIEGTLWHVPNGEILRVGNMSQEWARVLLDVAVAYGTDVDVASDLIVRVASEMAHEDDYADRFLGEPEIWGVQALGDDSVDIRLVIKTQPGEQWGIARELRRRLKNAFDVAEVEIPFPQRTVWLRTETPVAFGDANASVFKNPVPDEATLRRAVEASKRGDTRAARTTTEFKAEPSADELSEQASVEPAEDDDQR